MAQRLKYLPVDASHFRRAIYKNFEYVTFHAHTKKRGHSCPRPFYQMITPQDMASPILLLGTLHVRAREHHTAAFILCGLLV
jgi:hypothetical protein